MMNPMGENLDTDQTVFLNAPSSKVIKAIGIVDLIVASHRPRQIGQTYDCTVRRGSAQ